MQQPPTLWNIQWKRVNFRVRGKDVRLQLGTVAPSRDQRAACIMGPGVLHNAMVVQLVVLISSCLI